MVTITAVDSSVDERAADGIGVAVAAARRDEQRAGREHAGDDSRARSLVEGVGGAGGHDRTRINPSWTTVTARVPSRVYSAPPARPLADDEEMAVCW